MQIEIIDISKKELPNKNGKGKYNELTVAYRADGKIQEKKLVSFSNPLVFTHLETLTKGDKVNLITEKIGDYWQWTAIEPEDTPKTEEKAVKYTGSTYETKEERAVKQRYIVRQSSITAAISILNLQGSFGKGAKEEVLAIAEDLEAWVFRHDATDLSDIVNDIPE